MARHPDGSADHPEWLERGAAIFRVWPDHDQNMLIRDVELGYRASEKLDILEDENEISWWAEQAQLEALFKAPTHEGRRDA